MKKLLLFLLLVLPLAAFADDEYNLSLFEEFTAESINSNYSGNSVSSAGDVNGDGYEDFLIGSNGVDDSYQDAGAVYLIYGSATPLTSASLSTAVEFTGEVAEDDAAYSVASAGDVNGDGYSDILVGAPYNDDAASAAGAAYLIYGSATPLTSASLSTAVEFTGVTAGDEAGYSVASAGDVNNDTYDDILVGAPYNVSHTYLILGSVTPLGGGSLSTAVIYTEEAVGDMSGYAVSSAGDVDNDGYDDILIGAPYRGATDTGSAYLIWGSGSPSSVNLSTAVEFTGVGNNSYAGNAVASAGDVDNNGYDDILIGSSYYTGAIGTWAGAAYLQYGAAVRLAGGSLNSSVRFTGEVDHNRAGKSVSSAGDVNNDGYDDFLVGAFTYSTGDAGGAAYLIYGSGTPLVNASLSTAVRFTGEVVSDGAGFSVSSAGDVNNDNYYDFLIGAPYKDDTGREAGSGYLIYGQAAAITGRSLSADIEFTAETHIDYQAGIMDNAGQSVSSAGDVNGDGYDDFLASAPDYNTAGAGGMVYLIYGSGTPLTGDQLSTAVEFTGEISAGTSVASAGDVDNDGYDDILIGDEDGNNTDGAVYLIYGSSSPLASSALSTAVKFSGIEDANETAGKSVASAGDVNGDGYDDILIGAPEAYIDPDEYTAYAAGAVYLIYGSGTDLTSSSLSDAIRFTGEVESDYAGYSVSSAGDVDGDGYDDILIGAEEEYDDDGYGSAYLLYGSSTPFVSASLSTAVKFTGEDTYNYAGYSVSSAGDVDADGYDDFLIGANGADSYAGAAYLIYGQATNLSNDSLSNAIKFSGEAAGNDAGHSVSSAGDVNNDSYDDILVGAPYSSTGAAYLVYGQETNLSDDSLSNAIKFTGEAAGDQAGISVATAGDVDGNGYDDVIIGADYNCDAGIDGGAVYLGYLFAATDGILGEADIIDDDHDGVAAGVDCNDDDPNVSVNQTYYIDSDGDGYGNTTTASICAATPPAGYSSNNTDCNDSDSAVNANQTYYLDADGDGLGDPNNFVLVCSATPPDGYVANDDETDDGTGGEEEEEPEEETSVEIGGDGIDNDGDGVIDEANSLSENGVHPIYGTIDPSDQEAYLNSIISVRGYTNGNILVTYKDNSVYSYNIYSIVSKKKTKVKQYQNTGYYLVLHPWGKKLALVNVYNGEVLSRKLLSKKVKFKNNAIKIYTMAHSKFATIISKKKLKVRLYVVKIKISETKLTKKAKAITESAKIKIKKTTKKKNSIYLNNQKGKHIREYQLSYLKKKAKYKLYLVK
ncbi:MAG: integrin alpha [Patescibacteria group bacterium]|jgi:hypothetical protein